MGEDEERFPAGGGSDEFQNPEDGSDGEEAGDPIGWLRTEVRNWVRERLISEKQSRLILMRYGLIPGETIGIAKRRDLVFWVSVLGGFLVGIGILLIVAANWGMIPKTARLFILLMATAGFYYAGYRRGFASAIGKAFCLIGSLAWGASLFLVGQMYHFSGRAEAHLVGVWALGVFPLAYILPSLPHLYLGLVTALIYLSILWFGEPTPKALSQTMGYFLAISVLIYLIGVFHYRPLKLKGLARSYSGVGAVLIAFLLFVLSFRGTWTYALTAESSRLNVFAVAAGLAAVFLTAANLLGSRIPSETAEEDIAFFLLALLSGGLIFLWPPVLSYEEANKVSYLPYLVLNLLLFVAAIRLIFIGVERLQPRFVNYGLVMFFVLVTCRFFELFGTLMNTGLLFIFGGIFLLFLGYVLSRQRARLLKLIDADAPGRNHE
jgi:uncharacterized membrane protein